MDGKDILHVRGNHIEIEHIQYDQINSVEFEFFWPLPRKEVTVLLKNVESQAIHPFVLEQPAVENDYTAKVYLDDRPGGYGWWEFELYYLEERPDQVGLAIAWP